MKCLGRRILRRWTVYLRITELEEAENISVEDLENLEDPEPIAGIASDDSNDEEVEEIDPEDIPDPEPFQAASFDAEPDNGGERKARA